MNRHCLIVGSDLVAAKDLSSLLEGQPGIGSIGIHRSAIPGLTKMRNKEPIDNLFVGTTNGICSEMT